MDGNGGVSFTQAILAALGLAFATTSGFIRWLYSEIKDERIGRTNGDAELWKAVDRQREQSAEQERRLMTSIGALATKDDLLEMEKRLTKWSEHTGVHAGTAD